LGAAADEYIPAITKLSRKFSKDFSVEFVDSFVRKKPAHFDQKKQGKSAYLKENK
jgi:hypothetical protein